MAVSQRPFDPYRVGVKVYRAYRAGGRAGGRPACPTDNPDAMFNETREGNPSFTISIPEYNQQRREFGFVESSLVIHIFFIFLNCNDIEQYVP
jgi:hypothetical protein